METPQMDGFTALGATIAKEIPFGHVEHRFESWIEHRDVDASKITAVTFKIQGSIRDKGVKGITNTEGPALAIGSTPERFANGAFQFRINDVNYIQAVDAVGAQFTDAHVVTASKFGVVNIYVNAAGSFLTLVAALGQSQITALAAANAEAALVISDGVGTPPAYCYVGRILVEANGTTWTANVDNMTDAGDLTTATFISAIPPYTDLFTVTYGATDLIQQRKSWTISHTWDRYMRIFLSTLTGTGKVSAMHRSVGTRR